MLYYYQNLSIQNIKLFLYIYINTHTENSLTKNLLLSPQRIQWKGLFLFLMNFKFSLLFSFIKNSPGNSFKIKSRSKPSIPSISRRWCPINRKKLCSGSNHRKRFPSTRYWHCHKKAYHPSAS